MVSQVYAYVHQLCAGFLCINYAFIKLNLLFGIIMMLIGLVKYWKFLLLS